MPGAQRRARAPRSGADRDQARASRRRSRFNWPGSTSARTRASSESKATTPMACRSTTCATSRSRCGRRGRSSSPRPSRPKSMRCCSRRPWRPSRSAAPAGPASIARSSASTSWPTARSTSMRPYACWIPTPLPPSVWQQLRSLCSAGRRRGDLPRPQRPARRDLQRSGGALNVLPGPLLPFPPRDRDVFLCRKTSIIPCSSSFKSQQGDVPWNQFPVFQYWRFGNLAPGTNVVIPYNNRRPALVERNLDRGHVLVLTTPVSDAATDPRLWNVLATGDVAVAVREAGQRDVSLPGRQRAVELHRGPAGRTETAGDRRPVELSARHPARRQHPTLARPERRHGRRHGHRHAGPVSRHGRRRDGLSPRLQRQSHARGHAARSAGEERPGRGVYRT